MKDNLPILEVKALGGFSMRYGEKTISIGSGKSTKAVKLLQILVCSEGRTVSRERLLDMLYGNEDITDAANNLRVTTFRLKKMLVTAGLPQYDYIQIKSGMYSFAAPMEVVLDADGFVSLCDQADETENAEEKIDLLKKACQLYGGDYLPDFICDGVVLAKNSNYKEKYTNALNTLCELLMDRGEYETAIEVCEPACRMYPFDEWQAIQIDCLMRMKKYDEALKEYENTAKMFVDELGVYPSERMMKLFEQMNGRMNFKTQSLPEMEKKGTPASPATARASRVLPVPGGPTSSRPFGIDAPASVVVLMERSMFSPFPYSASAVVSVAASELVMDWSFEVTKLFMPHVSSGSTSSALL